MGIAVVLIGLIGGAIGVALVLRSPGHSPPRAAIVDQLALTDANEQFVERATDLLQGKGYKVDYFPPEAISVDFYRDLPKRGYKLVILRSHSSQRQNASNLTTGAVTHTDKVALFTNELYSTRTHLDDQLHARLGIGSYPERDIEDKFFVVGPDFVQQSMHGRFDGTIVVLMGCGGLSSDGMARAFIDRGARAFISWSDQVTAAHTDDATAQLLTHLVTDKLDARQAVAATMAESGPDLAFGSQLVAYP